VGLGVIPRQRSRSGRPSRERLQRVLSGGAAATTGPPERFAERVIRPVLMRAMSVTSTMASKSAKENLRERLMRAGFPGALQTEQWLTFKYLMAVALPVALVMITSVLLHRFHVSLPPEQMLLTYVAAGALGVMMGYMGPDFYINKQVKLRQKQILLSLPDLIDLLAVSVEAGLGFDAAISRVSERFHGPLGDEFARVRQEISVGRPRAEALREMARRCEVPDLTSFITSLIQAEQLGVSIGNVLRVQSDQMRERRSQRAREQAQRAPVKMMIPLVLFIFPTLFIVIMGPAAIKGFGILKASGLF